MHMFWGLKTRPREITQESFVLQCATYWSTLLVKVTIQSTIDLRMVDLRIMYDLTILFILPKFKFTNTKLSI